MFYSCQLCIDPYSSRQQNRVYKVLTHDKSFNAASECNRLKLQLEDMRQAQEAKDNTMMKIQEQIQRLFEVHCSLKY